MLRGLGLGDGPGQEHSDKDINGNPDVLRHGDREVEGVDLKHHHDLAVN